MNRRNFLKSMAAMFGASLAPNLLNAATSIDDLPDAQIEQIYNKIGVYIEKDGVLTRIKDVFSFGMSSQQSVINESDVIGLAGPTDIELECAFLEKNLFLRDCVDAELTRKMKISMGNNSYDFSVIPISYQITEEFDLAKIGLVVRIIGDITVK